MGYLKNLDVLRNIEWDRSYLWDVKLEGPPGLSLPADFKDWFPATEIDDTPASVISKEVTLPATTAKIAIGTSSKNVKVTFNDNSNGDLWNFFIKWYNEIVLNNGDYVATLSEYMGRIFIRRLNQNRDTVSTRIYNIYPEDEILFSGGSDSRLTSYTINFVVCY